jgi:lipopolysaccharide assembly protein A
MLKKIGVILVFLLVFAIMLVFAKLNPGSVDINLAFTAVEASIPLTVIVVFVGGWLFGLLCTVMFVARLVNERRQLRKALRNTESEVSSLRSLPINDAD